MVLDLESSITVIYPLVTLAELCLARPELLQGGAHRGGQDREWNRSVPRGSGGRPRLHAFPCHPL